MKQKHFGNGDIHIVYYFCMLCHINTALMVMLCRSMYPVSYFPLVCFLFPSCTLYSGCREYYFFGSKTFPQTLSVNFLSFFSANLSQEFNRPSRKFTRISNKLPQITKSIVHQFSSSILIVIRAFLCTVPFQNERILQM